MPQEVAKCEWVVCFGEWEEGPLQQHSIIIAVRGGMWVVGVGWSRAKKHQQVSPAFFQRLTGRKGSQYYIRWGDECKCIQTRKQKQSRY
jgi:hypothetical protein